MMPVSGGDACFEPYSFRAPAASLELTHSNAERHMTYFVSEVGLLLTEQDNISLYRGVFLLQMLPPCYAIY
jgi:hypothetical protein